MFSPGRPPAALAAAQRVARSDRRVGELTALAGQPQSLVSYHLGRLRDGGLVSTRRSSADGRDTYYCSTSSGAVSCCPAPARRCIPASRHPAAAPRRERRRRRRGCCSCAPATAPARRWPRRSAVQLSGGAVERRERGQPSQAGASQRGAGDARARHRHRRASLQAPERVRRPALRLRDHALRPGARGLPGVPRRTRGDALEHPRPGARARTRRARAARRSSAPRPSSRRASASSSQAIEQPRTRQEVTTDA